MGQVTNCRIASGHWYTYWHTTLAGLLVVAHLYHHRKHKNARNSLLFYASWMAIYQVANTTLKNANTRWGVLLAATPLLCRPQRYPWA